MNVCAQTLHKFYQIERAFKLEDIIGMPLFMPKPEPVLNDASLALHGLMHKTIEELEEYLAEAAATVKTLNDESAKEVLRYQ